MQNLPLHLKSWTRKNISKWTRSTSHTTDIGGFNFIARALSEATIAGGEFLYTSNLWFIGCRLPDSTFAEFGDLGLCRPSERSLNGACDNEQEEAGKRCTSER